MVVSTKYVCNHACLRSFSNPDPPPTVLCWGLFAIIQSGSSGRWSFWTIRALIGACQSGFMPTSIVYLSHFYTASELPIRLSLFYAGYQILRIMFASFAYGTIYYSGLENIPGGKWIFALQGCLTCLLGCMAWYYLPPSPTHTASRFRGPKGWFSDVEEKIMVGNSQRNLTQYWLNYDRLGKSNTPR
jgi:MFS family permease